MFFSTSSIRRTTGSESAPAFRPLTEHEFEKLSLEQRISYIKEFAAHLQARMEETIRGIEEPTKKLS